MSVIEIITSGTDIRWACGFSGSNAVLVRGPEAHHLITDGRYRTQAAEEVRGAEVHIASGDLFAYLAEAQLLTPGTRVGFQADHLTVARADRLRALLPEVDWVPMTDVLTHEVAAKTPEEVGRIERAQAITDAVFDEMLGVIAPGMTEREVAAEVVYRHLRRGADRMSFDPIVASGPRAALPHARPTDRRLRRGEVVLLDVGCVVDGYACDMTRVVALGEPETEVRHVYEIVRAAQEAALQTARSGLTGRELDRAARAVIEEAGLGDYFTHSLGHGVGLQIHEWPRVSHASEDVLPEGCVVTIEPGVYLPGRFGIRIEDMVQLAPAGARNLTGATKTLVVR